MTLARILKTIFLIEFVKGLILAVKEMFRKSKTINYPFEKGPIAQLNVIIARKCVFLKKNIVSNHLIKVFF